MTKNKEQNKEMCRLYYLQQPNAVDGEKNTKSAADRKKQLFNNDDDTYYPRLELSTEEYEEMCRHQKEMYESRIISDKEMTEDFTENTPMTDEEVVDFLEHLKEIEEYEQSFFDEIAATQSEEKLEDIPVVEEDYPLIEATSKEEKEEFEDFLKKIEEEQKNVELITTNHSENIFNGNVEENDLENKQTTKGGSTINEQIFGTSSNTRNNPQYDDIERFVEGFVDFFHINEITDKQYDTLVQLRKVHLAIMDKRAKIADRLQANENIEIPYFNFSLFIQGQDNQINDYMNNIDLLTVDEERQKALSYYQTLYLQNYEGTSRSEKYLSLQPLFDKLPKIKILNKTSL